jgi:acyl transferase domain-containing protein/enoyl-CoA hydratase/carnithine racemase
MDDPLKTLYSLIKEGKISPHEGTQQIKAYRNQRLSPKGNSEVVFTKSYTHNENLLKDHRVFGEQVLMGVAHCSLVLQALTEISTKSHVILSNVIFLDAIRFLPSDTIQVDVVLKRQSERISFENRYFKQSLQRKVATATGQIVFVDSKRASDETVAISDWTGRSINAISGDIFYKHSSQEMYGETLCSVKKVYLLDQAVFSEIELSAEVKEEAIDYVCHPAVFDAVHVTSSFAMDCANPMMRHWVPFAIKNLRFIQPSSKDTFLRRLYCYVKPVKSNSEISKFDCRLYGEQGELVLDIDGFCTKRVPSKEAILGIRAGNTSPSTSSSGQSAEVASDTSVPLQEKIQAYLKEKIASLLGKRKYEIEARINFMDMGLESNQLVQMSQKIEERIGIELMPTVFFEYQNIEELSHYFTEEHADPFAAYFGIAEQSTQTMSPPVSAVTGLPDTTTPEQSTVLAAFKSSDHRSYSQDDIAVIGMDGRLAQSPDLRTFWEHIRNSKDLISEIPKSHWDYELWFDENREAANKTYSKWGSFLDDVDNFDPLFFGISPRQAIWVDPQLRILLEVIYGVLEDGGYVNQIRGSKTGMYTGVCFREYWDEIVRKGISITDYEHTSSSMASLSGYISYAFDLHGGSIPLDNACASSLTAMHLACQALKTGECDLALVAGTNLLLSPLHYVYFSRIQALSPTGRCHAFDKRADGYVPGEGVVAVLLKPLSKAIRDQDNIHAVIKGSAINHCGRSNNPTSPRPELQTKLLLEAWKNANINPETLSYIECHGTGTELGDPIEINAVKKAFKQFTRKTRFCAIGSTKAHVGHLEGAAGLASIIKVIWSMKNKTIPRMPTFKELNPLIQLNDSPLYINTDVEEWKTEGATPRRAGVSSFGMTGNNAHVVIEEYIPQNQLRSRITVAGPSPAIIVLSAKTEKQLYTQARRLLTAIQEGQFINVHLADMAYTLQVGRESLDERLAVIAGSIKELEKKLKGFLEGTEGIEDLYRGEVKRNKETLAAFVADEDMAKTIDAWIAKRKYAKLLDLWVKGLIFDWNKLYGDIKPSRISLPTYPFARESYWMPETETRESGTKTISTFIHPLLHQNTSNLSEQRFSSRFTGEEFFLTDHVVRSERVFPGVAYLEMARVAVAQSAGTTQVGLQLKNVIWGRFLVVGKDPAQVHIGLFSEDDGSIAYEIYGEPPGHGDPIVYSQGRAILSFDRGNGKIQKNLSATKVPHLDLAALKAECRESTLTSTQCYEAFHAMGVDYGPGHQGIKEVHVGAGQVLAKLSLPTVAVDTQQQYVLHPSLMDSALQASIAIYLNESLNRLSGGNSVLPSLPFALESLEILDRCVESMWAWVRYSEDRSTSPATGNGTSVHVQKLDIDLCDDEGHVLVMMRGVSIAEERQLEYSRLQESQTLPKINRKISLTNHKKERHPESQTVKPADISLLNPALPLSNFSSSMPAKQSVIRLDSLDDTSESPLRQSEASYAEFPVELYDYADGVFCVKLAGDLNGNVVTEAMILGLKESFRVIKEHKNAKVILLTGGEEWFLSGRTTQKEMLFTTQALRLTLDCDVPVIAVMKGHSKGIGWLLGCLCDLMICGEESSYEYFAQESTGNVSEEELCVFEERFGKAFTEELLFSKKHYTGRELREAGLSLPILPRHEVDAFALKMAYRMSEAPQKSLVLLKKHFSQEMARLVQNLSDSFAPSFKRKTVQGFREKKVLETSCLPAVDAESLPTLSEPKKIALGSEVVRLEAYSNGIALITLCDAASKNTFTEALVQGVMQAFKAIDKNPAYKVVILTGYDHYFSCGGTKEGLLAIQEGAIKFTDVKIYSLPLECDIPVIAAMQGHGIGAGWSLGMFCDDVILSAESVYLSPYMKYGFTPGAGSTLVFPEKFGKDLGREILFTATEYKGDELKLRGIKLPVLPRPEVLGYAMRLARQLALRSREELVEIKNRSCEKLRKRLEEIYAQELAMHEMSFLGNEDVLQRIQTHFDEGAQVSEEREHFEIENLEVTGPETDGMILERIRKTLRDTLADELRIQRDLMGDEKQFIDLGLDSIILVTWIRKINEAFGLSIPATRVYNHPTIAELASYVMKEGKQQGLFQPSETEATTLKARQKEAPQPKISRDAFQETHSHPLLPSRRNGRFRNISKKEKAEAEAHQEQKPIIQSIAIIGMAGQFPKSKTLDQFWDNLAHGRDCITEIPPSRWDITQYYNPDPLAPGKTYSRWMGTLEDVAQFDPQFFNISPKEAQWMDPQQRLFLQSCWHCVEDSGYQASQLSGSRCGVFVGCSGSDYGQSIRPEEINAQGFTGVAPSILAARISYFLNLQGPCLAIDTACSSSLVAIASACDSLVLRSSDLALAGGVCVLASPVMHIMTSKAGMLSKDGRCFTFDQRANGFVPGEGVGVVLLKRLEDAERDGDQIHGVICGWGVNQDGKTNGITAPNQDSQARLESEIYVKFGIQPEEIQFIETHGTGTKLGDPIEVEALKESFKAYTQKENYCALGSVKSNIGHTLAAAGVAGTIKVLLSLKNRKIPPTIHFDYLNEHIELKKSPFYINTECKDWNIPEGQKRRSAISSFGFSGTNAHLVIQEYVSSPNDRSATTAAPGKPVIFVLSARNKERLKEYARNWLNFIEKDRTIDPKTDLADLAYTLQVGREAMEERLGTIVHSRRELEVKLRSFVEGKEDIGDFYLGQVKRNKDTPGEFTADEDMAKMVDAWIAKGKYALILEPWVKGLICDWHKLYGDNKPRRISLPTYPFATDRYWVPEAKPPIASVKTITASEVCQEEHESTDVAHTTSLSFCVEAIAKEALQKELTLDLAKALYMNPSDVDVDRQLVDMGLDSILGVEWIQTINKKYDLRLTATTLYDHPTIDALAAFLEEQLRKRPRNSLPSAEVVSESVPRTVVNRSETQESFTARPEPIAIIGMSGRYPGAQDVHEYWSNLIQGKNSVREIPKERWDVNRYYDPDPTKTGKVYCKWLGVLDDIECFDPLFFMISPTEAEGMDPQHRIFLEEGYKAFEDAGYSKSSLNEMKCGVYLGIMSNEYGVLAIQNVNGQSGTNTSFAIGAARLPYYLNLKGPAIPIDTACSSSLVAAHLACQALSNGEIDMALVGGVSLYLAPEPYIFMCAAGMLSPEGQCKAFDDSADGFVPGEGVGAIVLKRLKDSERDNDFIWATIIGSGINQDGKTNGITAPSVNSQIELERGIYEKYDIDPGTITYIETHGTGTKLGDPIELEALSTVFKEKTDRRNYCALGSVKTNIGHSSAAAGVASIQKVLLSFKHKELAPSLHHKKPNTHFNLENSPFYVNRDRRPWTREDGKPYRAAISGFGFSGTNAHMVIEEYVREENQDSKRVELSPSRGVIIVLSARNKECLRNTVQRLKEYISKELSHQEPSINLVDLAYTLQVGREAMEERLGMIVHSLKELKEKLEEFMDEEKSVAGVYRGEVKRNKDTLAVFNADEDLQKAIDAWIAKGKYTKILDLWVKGLLFDWNRLYADNKPRRISLPTYPFARERYWLPTPATNEKVSTASIHPLLHQNTSNLSEQRFSSTFTGEEFFLRDHVVNGERVLPGVAYLEMARAAVAHGAGIPHVGQTGIKLKNVVWAQPIVVGKEPTQVHIGLFPEDNKQIAYEIYSESAESGEDPVVHSQGSAVISHDAEYGTAQFPTLDLAALQAECSENKFLPTECYEVFHAMGIDYGPGHQAIEEVHVAREQVLAKLCLPASVIDTQEQYVLHPSLMDAALQASIGLMMSLGDRKGALVPFALEELNIFGRCSSTMYALIRSSKEGPADKVRKLDIDLCDEAGNVCVQMKGFTSRVLEGKVDSVKTPPAVETMILKPYWKEQEIRVQASAPVYGQHLVILCELEDISAESMESAISGIRCLTLKSKQAGIDKRFQSYASRVFEEIQNILQAKPKDDVLIQIVFSMSGEQQLFAGLSGILKTAQMENPKIIGQVIEIDNTEGIVEKLKENSRSPRENRIRYQDGKRWIASWSEIKISQEGVSIPWKENGIYLITGGAGGLGFVFTKEIARQAKHATVILTGRSALNDAKQEQLKTLAARIEYKQVDVTEKTAVKNLVQSIQQEFGRLDGIIHGAGVIRDNFIIKKTKDELQEVLAPKVSGLVNLDEATKDLPLDLFICFSSAAAAMGNIGQADYATANAFMDSYAQYRNAVVTGKQRYGQTLSINWPLWQAGGMRVDAATEKMVLEDVGMTAMPTASGIQALYQGIASGESQVMAWSGDSRRAMECVTTAISAQSLKQAEKKSVSPIAADLLEAKAIDYLKELLSTVIKLPWKQIEADAPLEKYGIDSIMVMRLTNQLEQKFGSLSKTLFFEYRNLAELSRYFLENYREELTVLLGIKESMDFKDSAEVSKPVRSGIRRRSRARFSPMPQEQETIEIAIIGLAGRYPGARNIQAFLKNLRAGKDCVSEIPKERWDHSQYFDEDKSKPGKTYSKWGGFLEGVDEFDPLFFGISPREAEMMDPQERLFLECVYETLEDAGYTREDLDKHKGKGASGNVGVYVGVIYEEYQLYGAQAALQGQAIALPGIASSIANRVSYFCNFHGPSMAVDTMCSSSLTTIHLACESIKRRECELAIAGGVNVSIHPNKYLVLGQGKFVSSKGRCESFGQGGDGYVPGEGVGAVLLKEKNKAIADGDHIYAIVKGTQINHGGKSSGYYVPNPNAQASVIGHVFKKAGIDPRTISYLEAHGTGTRLGDPIEITGLKKAFETYTQDKQFCAIGSVKSNIGHCESAAGIAGVTKVLLQLKTRQIFPSLHAETLNPNIDFKNTPFVVQQELAEWKRPVIGVSGESQEYPRRAGISSFGAGGANAYVVIEEYIPHEERLAIKITPQNPAIVVLSAKNEERLKEQARQLLPAIGEREISDSNLADIAYTLQVGREGMEERLGLIVHSVQELEEKLKEFIGGKEDIANLYRGQVKRNKETLVVFAADEDLQNAINTWIAKGKYTKLLDLWVKGLVFDWNKLYGDNKPRRMSLPTYPFARERYWAPTLEPRTANPKTDIATIQLLQERTSDLSDNRLSNKPSHIALSSLSEEQTFFTSPTKVQQTLQRPLAEPERDHVLEVMEKLEKGTLSLDEAIASL